MVWVLVACLCSGFCAFVASGKKRSVFGWWFAGLIFGIFAVPVILALPAKYERTALRWDDNYGDDHHEGNGGYGNISQDWQQKYAIKK